MSRDEFFDRSSSGASPGSESPLEDVVAEYVDRLNAGERINPLEILSDHPRTGQQILDQLKTFIDIDSDVSTGSPLGTLGDYTLRREIGRGGMGVVYEAWQNSMRRQVALKVLPVGIAADTKACTRFMREAQTAGKLSHQNIVGVYSTGVEEGTPWYSMEYVRGETLAQILAREKDAAPEEKTALGFPRDDVAYYSTLARCFADVADGLQHAHSKGVVHRDIKPSNLIFDGERDRGGSDHILPKLRILDFGLARLEGQESLTLSGDLMGTVLYMSPEQAMAKRIPLDHRTDVYSLGVTIYEAITGRPPFRGRDHAETLSQIIEREPVGVRKLNPRVPRDLETIVLKCLRKDAADRYGTAEALGQDLRRFVRGIPIEARPQSGWKRIVRRAARQRWKIATGAALLLPALAAGVVSWKYFGERNAAPSFKRAILMFGPLSKK